MDYPFGMLMWEIYYEVPFKGFSNLEEFPYNNVINRTRPIIADNRPNVEEILVEIENQLRFLYQQPGATTDDFFECDYTSVICFPTHSSKHPMFTLIPRNET
ncbi:hypothetical protein Glove_319g73 [Diversispora epigaea]|uniref:Protein kinase domain-containing protein n=1 Tax=Diversispora epigaea TaxID=1348612 RepID=A0A397HPP6_9GLOM|nr:hypothetical protein Glove_319g73 [Diversispora epigaea]